MGNRARDSQRSKYYTAVTVLDSIARPLEGAKGRNLLKSVNTRKFLTSRYGYAASISFDIFVGTHKREQATRGGIYLNKNGVTDADVVRLAARMIFYRADRYSQQAWFGHEFCAIMLDVAQALMGREARDLLQESFRANRVRWKPKIKRTVTREMREHLAQAREKIKN